MGWKKSDMIFRMMRMSRVREQCPIYSVPCCPQRETRVKITAIDKTPVSKRIGVAKGKFTMPSDFDADSEYIASLFMGGE